MNMKKIAVITSGGDAPGMNAAIRAITKVGIFNSLEVIGFEDGFQGIIENRFVELTYSSVNNIIQLGGTIIGTARSKEFMTIEGRKKAFNNLKKNTIDGLIVIGGDGSFAGAKCLLDEFDLPVIGIPGTIDNDIEGTDYTIGYDTCLNTIVDAIDKIRDTATSHHRIFFVEVMGRHAGKLALNSAIASGAEDVLVPEKDQNIEDLANNLKSLNKGTRSSIVIVAEGDELGGAAKVCESIKPFLEEYDLRFSVLGHVQRGGNPSSFDRIVATQMGVEAVSCLLEGEKEAMIGLHEGKIFRSSLTDPIYKTRKLNNDKIELLRKVRTLK
ncbi:MAG: 6-phosphofructokinase [Fluviicola sp.]